MKSNLNITKKLKEVFSKVTKLKGGFNNITKSISNNNSSIKSKFSYNVDSIIKGLEICKGKLKSKNSKGKSVENNKQKQISSSNLSKEKLKEIFKKEHDNILKAFSNYN